MAKGPISCRQDLQHQGVQLGKTDTEPGKRDLSHDRREVVLPPLRFYAGEKQKDNWNENELRVFVWLLFAYANSLQKSPDEFVSIVETLDLRKLDSDRWMFPGQVSEHLRIPV